MSTLKKIRKEHKQNWFKTKAQPFIKLDLNDAPHIPAGMEQAYRNNKFTVMVYPKTNTTAGPAIRILIQSHTDEPIPNHWAEIQSIKNQIFGEEVTAIEYFPKQSELIDQHNIYWIFIYPDGVIPTLIQD